MMLVQNTMESSTDGYSHTEDTVARAPNACPLLVELNFASLRCMPVIWVIPMLRLDPAISFDGAVEVLEAKRSAI